MRHVLQAKLKKECKDSIRDIFQYGSERARGLDLITNVYGGTKRRLAKDLEVLRVSANYVGAYSLSSNQIGLDYDYFIMAKSLHDGVWSVNTQKDLKYNAYVNPQIKWISQVKSL